MEFVFLALAIAVCAALGYQLYRHRAAWRDCPIGISISIVLWAFPIMALLTHGSSADWPFPMLAWLALLYFAIGSGGIAVLFFLLWSLVRLFISFINLLRNKGDNTILGICRSAVLVGIILGVAGSAKIFLSLAISDSFYFPNYLLFTVAALLLVLWHRQLYRYAGKSEAFVANVMGLMMIAIPVLVAAVSFVILCHRQSAHTGEVRCKIGNFYDGFGLTWEAYRWYRRADKEGGYYLGRCYEYGRGVQQNYAKAAYWYHRGSSSSPTKYEYYGALRRLAYLYRNGLGVPRDLKKAQEMEDQIL